jgi:hypothetical protein
MAFETVGAVMGYLTLLTLLRAKASVPQPTVKR